MGGTLIQDIPTEVAGALEHSVPEPRFAIAHEVWVAQGLTALSTLHARSSWKTASTCQVNSRHHQAVKRRGAGFEVTATAPDGVIEGDGTARRAVLRGGAVAPGELLAHRRIPPAVRAVRPRRRRLGLAKLATSVSLGASACVDEADTAFEIQHRHRLDVRGVREQIERPQLADRITGIDKRASIARQRGHVARHVNNSRGAHADDPGQRLLRQPGAR